MALWIWNKINGYKTYICVVLVGLEMFAEHAGWITPETKTAAGLEIGSWIALFASFKHAMDKKNK